MISIKHGTYTSIMCKRRIKDGTCARSTLSQRKHNLAIYQWSVSMKSSPVRTVYHIPIKICHFAAFAISPLSYSTHRTFMLFSPHFIFHAISLLHFSFVYLFIGYSVIFLFVKLKISPNNGYFIWCSQFIRQPFISAMAHISC